jgi:putative hemolysin
MKAITLLVALALVALASAIEDQSASTASATYAWWANLAHAGVVMAAYMSCLSVGWVATFFANDGGSEFYYCLLEAGVKSTWTPITSGEAVA